jgi:hypothetical protein
MRFDFAAPCWVVRTGAPSQYCATDIQRRSGGETCESGSLYKQPATFKVITSTRTPPSVPRVIERTKPPSPQQFGNTESHHKQFGCSRYGEGQAQVGYRGGSFLRTLSARVTA